jgi:hypothetical protein
LNLWPPLSRRSRDFRPSSSSLVGRRISLLFDSISICCAFALLYLHVEFLLSLTTNLQHV